MASKKQQERIANGLCPKCGEPAAPYRLCGMCRMQQRLGRALDRMERDGTVSVTLQGRHKAYTFNEGRELDKRWTTPVVPNEGDKRFRPRLAGVPVNVEETIIRIFRELGRPLSVDEVMQAWGRLRADRKRVSVVADVRALVDAQQRRERRAAKRLAHAEPKRVDR